MFLNNFNYLIFASKKVGDVHLVKIQVAGIICFSRTHITYHFPYIFIFNGMNGVDHNFNKMECPKVPQDGLEVGKVKRR